MAKVDQSKLKGKIRDKLISKDLEGLLSRAGDAADIDVVMVTSGSQPGTHGRRIGSTRHDHGRAADLYLVKDGEALTFTDRGGNTDVEAFVTAAAAFGAIGIGAGVHYMGNKTIHVGYGRTPSDRTQLVWGAGGRAANAPAWLRRAAQAGWNNPATAVSFAAYYGEIAGRFTVVARGGLHLRKGPGLQYGVTRTIETGTEVTVAGFDGDTGEWARVDLEGDGLIDGHVHMAYLAPADMGEAVEEIEENEELSMEEA